MKNMYHPETELALGVFGFYVRLYRSLSEAEGQRLLPGKISVRTDVKLLSKSKLIAEA